MAAVLALLTLPLIATPAGAAGGDPGPAPFHVSAPSVSMDHTNTVFVTLTVSCIDQAVAEGAEVDIDATVVQGTGWNQVSGAGADEVVCAPGVQTVAIPIVGNGGGFHPGAAQVFVEFQGCISTQCIQAFGDSYLVLHRPR
ncbi:MAG TPA: hypothetical protein VH482_26640 [Thermomicrobiales bacterium]